MPNKKLMTKFKLENKDDSNHVIGVTITIDLNHSCDLVDRVLDNLSQSASSTLYNYKPYTEMPKKKKESPCKKLK